MLFAGENNYELKKKGLYVGVMNNDREYALDVKTIKKNLISRRLKYMETYVQIGDIVTALSLECSYDMENGNLCQGETAGLGR